MENKKLWLYGGYGQDYFLALRSDFLEYPLVAWQPHET